MQRKRFCVVTLAGRRRTRSSGRRLGPRSRQTRAWCHTTGSTRLCPRSARSRNPRRTADGTPPGYSEKYWWMFARHIHLQRRDFFLNGIQFVQVWKCFEFDPKWPQNPVFRDQRTQSFILVHNLFSFENFKIVTPNDPKNPPKLGSSRLETIFGGTFTPILVEWAIQR